VRESHEAPFLGDGAFLDVRLVGGRDQDQEGNSESGEDASSLLDGRPVSGLFGLGEILPPTPSLDSDHQGGQTREAFEGQLEKKDF